MQGEKFACFSLFFREAEAVSGRVQGLNVTWFIATYISIVYGVRSLLREARMAEIYFHTLSFFKRFSRRCRRIEWGYDDAYTRCKSLGPNALRPLHRSC